MTKILGIGSGDSPFTNHIIKNNMSKQIEEYAKEWKEFLEFREKKIALNMLSPEYKKAWENFINSISSSGYELYKYYGLVVESERYKDSYQATFEGMLSWIADGKPINNQEKK